jgi:hypothetical protein
MFGTYFVHFPGGRPAVYPGLEDAFEREKGDPNWSPAQQFEHELLGKEMFARKTYGTCTSAAVYQATVLRALGLPTRMILAIPVADASDDTQLALVEKGLTNHRVRSIAYRGLVALGQSFSAHTFLEVYVGHRWRRLNYAALGQNVLERSNLGLMVKVHTFNDLSEANLAATWGYRYGKGQRDKDFPHGNPYRLLEISDLFGKHAKLDNPPAAAEREHKQLTVTKAYGLDADDVPQMVRPWAAQTRQVQDGAGHFLLHGEEWFDGEDHIQYKVFMKLADRNFVLRAPGKPDVKAALSMNFFTAASQKVRELELVVPPDEYARMAAGVAYTLHPVNGRPGYVWKVGEGVTITKK